MSPITKIKELNASDKPRERLIYYGAPALSDIELLAIILRSGSLNSSALDLSAKVLKAFGSFKGLLDVDVKNLLDFPGIGVAKATSIKALCEISLRIQTISPCIRELISTPQDVFRIVKKYFYGKQKELLYLLSLDARSKVISVDLISTGTLSGAVVSPREVFKKAFFKNAAFIILVHNHPSGDPSPSSSDISLTKRIAKAGVLLGASLIDHVVVCDNSFVSMKLDGYFGFVSLKNRSLGKYRNAKGGDRR